MALRKGGMAAGRAARLAKVSVRTLYYALERERQTSSPRDRPRSGRPRKVTRSRATQIVRLMRDRKVGSLRKTRAELQARGISLSIHTIQNVAERVHLHARKPVKRPKITAAQAAARLAWARHHINDSLETVQSYVFLDEKTFYIGDASSHVWIYEWEDPPVKETGTRARTRARCPTPRAQRRRPPSPLQLTGGPSLLPFARGRGQCTCALHACIGCYGVFGLDAQ